MGIQPDYMMKHLTGFCLSFIGGFIALFVRITFTRFEHNLSKLQDMNIQLFFMSADPLEKAKIFAKELNLKSKIGYRLGIEEMRKLGLYVSEPRPNEVDYIFPEPGLFSINPKGRLHIIEISNAPFIRPDINLILRGINHIQENNYPIRGTH